MKDSGIFPCCVVLVAWNITFTLANPPGKLSRLLLIRSKGMSFMHTTVYRGRCGMGAATFHCGSLQIVFPGKIFIQGVRVFWVTSERNFSHEDDNIINFTQAKVIFSGHRSIQRTPFHSQCYMFVTLTLNEIINNYKSVDEIQWCYNSNKTSLPKLLNCTIHFWELYNKKIIWIFLCDECFRSKPTHHSCLVFSYRSHLYSIFCIQRSPTFPWWSGDS